jgi:hexosaminidase
MRLFIISVSLALLLPCAALGQVKTSLGLMPMPASVRVGNGELTIDHAFSFTLTGSSDPILESGVQRFLKQLSYVTGIHFRNQPSENATLVIHTDQSSDKVQRLGEDESYTLTISASGIKLTAPNPLGALHGLETLLQLVKVNSKGFAIPEATIQDQPRFPWRGLLIDVGRHFIPVDVLKRNLDAMAAVKMNVLHWHLYDNEGFRIESKRFPKLQEQGSDGRYYSQEEIKELVAYAHDRGIRVVPEFEMPGHSRSMFVGYPELASGPGPYQMEPGAPDVAMDPTREETYKFIDRFLDEMTKLFPDDYVHIGGDEVNGHQWDTNPKIQDFMHAHGMKSNQDLQAYFNQKVQKILSKHHRTMIGWDEVLHPDLPKTVMVQSWRGQESLATAAKQGYRGILSFGYYLDLMWPASRHYAVEPMSGQAASLSEEEKKRVLGGESCMWSEWITPENIDSRIWPRNAAIAERLWSPEEVQDPASMYARLERVSWRLQWLGLKHRSAMEQGLERIVETENIAPLRTLAEVVEPVKDYQRMDDLKAVWDFRAPLVRLVDVVRPESSQARQFRNAVQSYLGSGGNDRVAENQIRTTLGSWRDNDAKLRPMINQSFLAQELGTLSSDLSMLGSSGLFALDYLEKTSPSPAVWRSQQLALADSAATAKADLLLMIVEPVRQLIEASTMSASEHASAH